eukprot:475714-Prymnesium_polylepis.1
MMRTPPSSPTSNADRGGDCASCAPRRLSLGHPQRVEGCADGGADEAARSTCRAQEWACGSGSRPIAACPEGRQHRSMRQGAARLHCDRVAATGAECLTPAACAAARSVPIETSCRSVTCWAQAAAHASPRERRKAL